MSAVVATPGEAEDGLPNPRRRVASAAILAAIVLAVLDGAIANVALPTLARALDVSASASVWVVTGYQMALIVALLPCAALGESLGYRRVFTSGVVIFTGASALCALSPSLPWLVAARFLQGLGAAAIMALLAAMLRFTFPTRLLGTAIGLNATVVALSAAAGPTLGAAILSVGSWPWLFAVNVPIGMVVLLAARALPETPGHGRRLDRISVALNAAVFGPLVVGVDLLTSRPLAAVALLAVAAASLVALVRRELPRAAPLIPLDLLRGGTFRYSVVASVCCFAAQMVSYVALPFYLQHGLDQSPLVTGLYLTPWPLTVALAAPISGRCADRIPTAWLCAAGGFCLALGLTLASLWRFEGNLAPLIAFMMLSGLGFGFFQTPNNRNMLLSAPRARSGAAGGMQATARQCGQAAGAVIMALLFTLAPAGVAPRFGLAVGAALALAGGLVSLMRVGR
ncbi:MAG: MFS transporter [Janthinobacterium lividum]